MGLAPLPLWGVGRGTPLPLGRAGGDRGRAGVSGGRGRPRTRPENLRSTEQESRTLGFERQPVMTPCHGKARKIYHAVCVTSGHTLMEREPLRVHRDYIQHTSAVQEKFTMVFTAFYRE
jgi:hypothetical protein